MILDPKLYRQPVKRKRWYMVSTYRACGLLRRSTFFPRAESPDAAMKAVRARYPHALIYCCQELFA